jgi:hypothetical protein
MEFHLSLEEYRNRDTTWMQLTIIVGNIQQAFYLYGGQEVQ